MTKQISLCNLLQTAFAWQGFVPPSETNPPMVSRRWEQHDTQSWVQAARHVPYNDDNREKNRSSMPCPLE